MLFYLKKNYSTHNREQTRIVDIPQDDSFLSFEEISNYLKTYSKSVIKVENIKNKVLFSGWLSAAAKVFRRDYRLMIIAPKLFSCWVNMTYFVKNHDILLNSFQEIEQTLWKYRVNCVYQTCNSHFTDTEHTMTSWSCAKSIFFRLIKSVFLKLILVSLGQYQSVWKSYKSV